MITGVAASSPCMMALASISTSSGVKPAREATVGLTRKIRAGPLIVFSMPSRTSTTPGILAIASET